MSQAVQRRSCGFIPDSLTQPNSLPDRLLIASKAIFSSAKGIFSSRVHKENVPARVGSKGKLNKGTFLASGHSL